MALIDIVKMDQFSDDFVVEKFMSEHQWELRSGSQLIVNEGQEAIFVKGGEPLDTFTSGTHTLSTGNIPLLRKLINLPFGSTTPFTSEVWFVNITAIRNMKWGTPHRIPVFDPKVGYPVNVGAFGQWGFRIVDSQSFVRQLVGAKISVNSQKVSEYFIGLLNEKLSQTIANFIDNGFSVFQITTKLSDMSISVQQAVSEEFMKYGISLENYSINSVNIPPNEMADIQKTMRKKMEMEQLGNVNVGPGYAASQSFEIMHEAARNGSGMMAGAAGLGIGFGAGFPMGQQIAQNFMQQAAPAMNMGAQQQPPMQPPPQQQAQPAPAAAQNNLVESLKSLKQLFDMGLITEAEFNQKKAKLLESI